MSTLLHGMQFCFASCTGTTGSSCPFPCHYASTTDTSPSSSGIENASPEPRVCVPACHCTSATILLTGRGH